MAKKKAPDASLKGKKPINTAKHTVAKVTRNPGHITNKLKRSEVYGKYLQEKSKAKSARRAARIKEAEALGEEVIKQTPKTLENTREVEPTWVRPDDEEVLELDEGSDEFAPYFSDERRAKILITTRPRPSQQLFYFIADLQELIPSLHFYPRKSYSLKEICTFATNRNFTHLIVLGEKNKVCNGMTISHLAAGGKRRDSNAVVTSTTEEEVGDGDDGNHEDDNDDDDDDHSDILQAGPTAFFRVTNVVVGQKIPHHGNRTSHIPELNLYGFNTRLGHRIGRFLGSLFPHAAELEGRQIVTFHNQRDYIFVRHHRYKFKAGADIAAAKAKKSAKNKKSAATKKDDGDPKEPPTQARLQELGPRFTLRLRWLQEGSFDTQFGEYEWFHKRKEMDTTRRKFHL